ncbi:hypothetical protein Q7P35_007202 [Cladosporium inversicolor]
MRSALTYVGFGLAALVSAVPQNKQGNRVVSCQEPTLTSMVVVDETITRTLTTTIGLLPDVTSTILETATITIANEPVCTSPINKRDIPDPTDTPNPASLTQSALYYHYRNPHIPPRPISLPLCPGPTSTKATTTTLISLLERTLTTSIATPTAQTVTTTATSNSCPTLPATVSQTGFTSNYTLTSRTCGRTLSYSNPGNTNPPVTLLIRTKVLACEAAQQCATAARNQGAGYLSFDLHYRYASGWECVMFFGRNPEGEGWDVVDGGFGEGVGYSA